METRPRFLKAISSINGEPKRETATVHNIMLRDISGKTGREIAEELGLSESRVSVVKNSPLYKERHEAMLSELKSRVVGKCADSAVGDKVKEIAEKAAVDITEELVDIAQKSDKEFARIAAAKEIYKRAGLDTHLEKEMSITIDQKLSNRLNRVLDYDETGKDDGGTKITIKEKVSS